LVLPHTARLQALASDFWPVLGGAIVRTGENSDRKVWVSGWWCQRGRVASGRNGTKFAPDPQKSHFEPILAIWRRFCPVLVVSLWGSVVDRWARARWFPNPAHAGDPLSRWHPHSPRLQALVSDFWPVMEGSTVRTGDNSDRKQYRRLRWSYSSLVLPHTARLQALASDFWLVLGGSIIRTGPNSDRKVWASGWWCQLGRGCSDRSGTKFAPDP